MKRKQYRNIWNCLTESLLMIRYNVSFYPVLWRVAEYADTHTVHLVSVAGKELEDYLYRNDELGCYIRDVITADGKETHNTGKKDSEDVCDVRNLNKFNVMSTEWGICLSSHRLMKRAMRFLKCRRSLVFLNSLLCYLIDMTNGQIKSHIVIFCITKLKQSCGVTFRLET